MSGKSTLLRAIGLNAVLAQAGAPVCATSLSMPPRTSRRASVSRIRWNTASPTSWRRSRSLKASSSARHPHDGRVVLYLLDEILQGTNTAERAIAVRGVARHLLEAGAIGVMTTHDLVALPPNRRSVHAARLVHFTEILDEHGHMTFDYRLRPGLATSKCAALMQLIGMNLEE